MGRSFTIQYNSISNRYRILSPLGIGGGSSVYLAKDQKLGTYHAVKCFSKTCSTRSRFYHEANLLRSLNHPFIPLFYDMTFDAYFFYLVEEYIQGESLATFVLHHQISQDFVIWIGIKLCHFLDFLHKNNPCPVLYLDLKPEHIIVCESRIKIIDYGSALYLSGRGKICQNYGTKEFAAPEQFHGLPVDTRADIYSLGAILSFLMHHSQVSYSKNFKKIVSKATKKSPDRRFMQISELEAALRLENESI